MFHFVNAQNVSGSALKGFPVRVPGPRSLHLRLPQSSDLFFRHEAGEMIEGPVVSLFCVLRKAATRQLPAFQVVLQAFTAETLPRASAVAAVAHFEILFFPAFHRIAFNECFPLSCLPWR
jgi:hypothetical protein